MAFGSIYEKFSSSYERAWSCWPERMLRVYADYYVLKNAPKVKQGAGNDISAAKVQLSAPGHVVRKRLSPPLGVALVSDFVDITLKYRPSFLRQALVERQAADLTPLIQDSGAKKLKAAQQPCA